MCRTDLRALDRLLDWCAHQFLCFSSISFGFIYSYVRQTKLASSLVYIFWAHDKYTDWLIDWLIVSCANFHLLSAICNGCQWHFNGVGKLVLHVLRRDNLVKKSTKDKNVWADSGQAWSETLHEIRWTRTTSSSGTDSFEPMTQGSCASLKQNI